MPIIRVEMLVGRGGKPDALQVVIQDIAKEDWGAGGILMADKYPDKT